MNVFQNNWFDNRGRIKVYQGPQKKGVVGQIEKD